LNQNKPGVIFIWRPNNGAGVCSTISCLFGFHYHPGDHNKMSQKLKELRAKEARLAKLTEELKALENDKELKTDLKLRDEIEALLKKYNRPAAHLAELFDLRAGRGPGGGKGAGRGRARAAGPGAGRQRRRRRLKIYTNPVTGEVVKTRGANHKILKAWKAEHGAEKVEGWAQFKE
jgi:uncharacterized protein YdcH (DUF465 family)